MEDPLALLTAFLFFTIALLVMARLLAFALHAVGLNPPEWLMETGLGSPSRLGSALFVLAFVYIIASLFFELPIFDLFAEASGGNQ